MLEMKWVALFVLFHKAFSRDVTAAMLVFQTISVKVELFSYVNAFFCSNLICIDAGHVSENAL